MNIATKPKVVLLGMMTKMPFAGVVWQTVHYLIGFRRLGFDVYYIEAHGCTPRCFMEDGSDDYTAKAADFIDSVMHRFDLGDRWAYDPRWEDDRYFGMSRSVVKDLCAEAAFIVNLHGGTEPLDIFASPGRLVYLETDPVEVQIELHDKKQHAIEFLEAHAAFYSFGENIGAPDCKLPVSDRFQFKPTRQPVVMNFWKNAGFGPAEFFTSVGNWRQEHRKVELNGEVYHWNKEYEFQKFIDLPLRSQQRFELALSSYESEDQAFLESKGWRIQHALYISDNIDAYRRYIGKSRGEFTVAKDQNVRLRSGWFSDRSATYLAAGRPVITQETGFSNVLPTGTGLFAFSSMEEILAAIETINGDYEKQRRGALEIAREYFDSSVVLKSLVDDLGVALRASKARAPKAAPTFPPDLVLTPLSRRPLELPPSTIQTVLAARLPAVRLQPDDSSWRVSVIVVTHNGLVFSKLALGALLENTRYPNYEVIVVDNGSTDGTTDLLRELAQRNSHVRVLFNKHNAGFAAANNQGLAAATGDVLVLLNNDAIVPPHWLGRLLPHLAYQKVGLLCPVTNRIGNEAEIETTYRTYGEFLAFAHTRSQTYEKRSFKLSMAAMFCLAMRRDTFQKLGLLDEQFGLGLFEDDDYSARARAAGLQIICAENVFVHHFSEASFGALAATGEYARLFELNRQRFEAKWGIEWQRKPPRTSAEYQKLTGRIRETVQARVPSNSTVLVVSKGDEELLRFEQRTGSHFPQEPNGTYAGHYPADSGTAIAHLETLRERGAQYLLLPAPAFWWLDHYQDFGRHLESNYTPVVGNDECILYSLQSGRAGKNGSG